VPGLVLPLHIFEPRYRMLVEALLALPDEAPRQFGVVAIKAGREVGRDGVVALHAIGCTAELREVTPYSDGRFDIVTVGQARFRLLELDEEAGTPYLTGRVDLLREVDGDDALEELTQRVALRFAAYRERLAVEQSGVPTDPGVLSYLVAAATVLPLPDRQSLLEQPTTAHRLRAELVLLRREIALIDAYRTLPAVDLVREEVNPN
jgi:Lon protease-like protein